jgi:aspartate-semialdehyde dehydrogenase
MIPGETGYSVAIVGASSLLGRELRAVIRERHFPTARLIELEAGASAEAEPELPVLDIEKDEAAEFLASQASVSGIDLAFLTAPTDPAQALLAAGLPPLVIDVDGGLAEPEREPPQIAFVESGDGSGPKPVASGGPDRATQIVAAAHPVTIMLTALLLRLASRAEISRAVAHVLSPASHLGPRGIEELQKQTVNLLSFQKIPRAIFGSQLAFNLLPRLAGSGSGPLEHLEKRLRSELSRSLAGRAPLPSLRLLQSAVFYSTSVSLYVETAGPLTPAQAAQALAGEPVRLGRGSDRPPSQVEVTGSAEILLDSITADADHPNGLWIWAVADNLRLAATNAVQIAEKLLPNGRPPQTGGERAH